MTSTIYTLNFTNGRVDWVDVTEQIEAGLDPVAVLESVRAGRCWIHAELVREDDQTVLATYTNGTTRAGA